MRANFYKKWLVAIVATLGFVNVQAQDRSEEQRYNAMLAEGVKITEYIEQHIDDDIPKEVYDLFAQYQEKHGHDHEHVIELETVSQEDLDRGVKRLYLRALYFKENPGALEVFQLMVLGPCVNGDLEM